jgi:hypothetical protein
VGQGGVAHGGNQVVAEASAQTALVNHPLLDDARQKRLAHILHIVRILEEDTQISPDGRSVAHHELDRILNLRPARGNLIDVDAWPLI